MQFRKIFIILLSSLLMACSPSEPVFHDTQDQAIQFSKLKGKWIVINYWAPWCHSCVKEIPELNRFYQHHQKDNIVLLGVNFEVTDNPKEAAKKAGIQFTVLKEDPSQFLQLGSTDVVPMTVIINPEGQVVKKILGPTTERSLVDTLHSLQK